MSASGQSEIINPSEANILRGLVQQPTMHPVCIRCLYARECKTFSCQSIELVATRAVRDSSRRNAIELLLAEWCSVLADVQRIRQDPSPLYKIGIKDPAEIERLLQVSNQSIVVYECFLGSQLHIVKDRTIRAHTTAPRYAWKSLS